MSYRIHSWKSFPCAPVRSACQRPVIPGGTLSLTLRHGEGGSVRQVTSPLVPLLKWLEQVSVDLEDYTPTKCLYSQREAVRPELA